MCCYYRIFGEFFRAALGFNAVGEIAKRIEMAARQADDIECIKNDMAPLIEAYTSTKAFIQKENVS